MINFKRVKNVSSSMLQKQQKFFPKFGATFKIIEQIFNRIFLYSKKSIWAISKPRSHCFHNMFFWCLNNVHWQEYFIHRPFLLSMEILEDKLSKRFLRMVLTKQLVLGLLSFRFMLLLLLGRFARFFIIFIFLLLLLLLLLLFTLAVGSWFLHVEDHHCNFTTSLYSCWA